MKNIFVLLFLMCAKTAAKTYRVGITAHDLYDPTWAIIHHVLSMYETIDNTDTWEPYLLLHKNISDSKTVRNYTYRSLDRKLCSQMDTVVIGTYSWELDDKDKYCPNTHLVRFVQGATYLEGVKNFVKNMSSTAAVSTDFGADTVWYTPQYKWSESYLKYMNNAQTSVEAPYVWTPRVFESRFDETFTYTPNTAHNIGIYETNRGIYKMSIIPMIITEEAYKNNKNITGRANGLGRLSTYRFEKDFLTRTKAPWTLFKKLGRIPETWFNNNIGTVISHQTHCSLNYLYLEALYSGMALVHNSELLAECGYYYDGFNITAGALAVENAIRTHDHNTTRRMINDECVYRFSVNNPKNIQWYERILNNTL